MTKQVQRRRGTATQHTSFTGAEGEISVNTTNKSVHVHDGVTAGGFEAARADLGNVSDASLNTALAGNTLSSLTITSADINGGTIDGTVIGGTTPAAGSFTQANFGDNNKAIFGAGSDLQIYHDGSNSRIYDTGTGDLRIQGTNLRLQDAQGENFLYAVQDNAVTLYYDNAAKFATTSTGVDVTGTVTADGLTNSGSSTLAGNIFFNSTSGAFRFGTDAGTEKMTLRLDGDDLKLENGAGFERVRFTNGGNVGIGTSSPSYKLVVSSGGASGIEFGPAYSGTANLVQHYSRSGGVYVDAVNDAAQHRFNIGGSEKVRIDSSGKVGIGTSSPDGNLTVGSTTTSGDISIRIKGDATSRGFLMFGDAGGAQLGDIMYDHSTDHMRFRVNNSERMRIDSSGNVGIGSTNPQSALDLAEGAQGRGITWAGSSGTARYNSIFSSYSGASLVLSSLFHGSTSADSYVTSFTGTTRASGIRLNWTNNNGIQFFTDTAAAKTAGDAFVPSERMRIDSSGNLLVGTTSTTTSTVGFKWRQDLSRLLTVADGGSSASFGRLTSDGDIVLLQKDGTTVGSIGSVGGDVFLGTGVAGLRFADANPSINPHNTSTNAVNDGAISLGTSSARFKDLYLSGGVYLGGTGAANLLDDYEEGSFTPVVADAASGGNEATYLRNLGYYTKVGRQVTIIIELTNIDTTGLTGTNDMYITGLPFISDSPTGAVRWVGSMQQNYISLGANTPYLTPTVYESADSIRITEHGDNTSGDTVTVSQLTSGSADMNITLTYFTS